MVKSKDGVTYYKASDIVQRISKKYQANRVWIWDVLEEQYNIIKGTGGVLTADEVKVLEEIVKESLEE